jgi:hypothetical protein
MGIQLVGTAAQAVITRELHHEIHRRHQHVQNDQTSRDDNRPTSTQERRHDCWDFVFFCFLGVCLFVLDDLQKKPSVVSMSLPPQ